MLSVGVLLLAQGSLALVSPGVGAAGTEVAPAPAEALSTASSLRSGDESRPAEGTPKEREGFSESGWAKWSFDETEKESVERRANRHRGNGRRLLIASAILGGVTLTMNTTRAAWFSVACKREGYHYDDGCFGSGLVPGYVTVFLGWPAFVLNHTGIGLAAVGGRRWGSSGPMVSPSVARRHVVWGSVTLGVGIAVQIASAVLAGSVLFADSDEIYDGDRGGDAFRRRYVGASFGAQAGATMTAVGGGLLSHGLAQRKRVANVDVAFSATGFSLRF